MTVNLPWIEKYRPQQLNDLISHEDIIHTLQNFISKGNLPHLLFYGPPGTGKTSSILAIAKQMYDKHVRSLVLELNASDDRGIEVVRTEILNFASNMTIQQGKSKLIILDEADAMTKDAQNALKRIIEKYSEFTRFCLICNYQNKIIPAIQSRCTRFRFSPLKSEQIQPRLIHIINEEKVNYTPDGLEALIRLSNGDMRQAINVLQCTSMSFDTVNAVNVYACVGKPTPQDMKLILNILSTFFILKFDFAECFGFCDIQFPKSYVAFSTRFNLYTNHEKEKLTKITSYIPDKTYDITVSLNDKAMHEKLTIKEIYVLVSNVHTEMEELSEHDWKNAGEVVFNVTHASKTEYCPQRAYVQYLYTQPQHVTFYWIAPKIPNFCIRITVILKMNDLISESKFEERSHWICEQKRNKMDQMQADQYASTSCAMKQKTDPVKQCNIGSTAVYRMTIENKWNLLNHWKDWPGKDGYSPKITQYLGASHSNEFNIYHLGGMANEGVSQVCGNGSYTELQKQFYKAGNGIMTVILARSLDASSKTNKRSALIVVNATQHLVSFLARLHPSPDWCTGLSRFDLCNGSCKWQEKFIVHLYPWDAGVYSGETYLNKNEKTRQTPICPITSSWPKDNPFTVMNGKIKNIGVVTFQLIQEYNKNDNQYCNSINSILQDEAYQNEPKSSALKSNPDKTRHCLLSEWSEWSSCSESCGKGEKTRYRKLLKGKSEQCIESSLTNTESCSSKCSTVISFETCSFRLWGQWSPCNATCSQKGIIHRERVFINEQEKHECMQYSEMKASLECALASERCKPDVICKEYVYPGDSCSWSSPSQRFYYDFSSGTCNAFIYKGCYGGLNNFHTYEECILLCRPKLKETDQRRFNTPETYPNRCGVSMTWGIFCDSQSPSNRWYYDNINKECYRFRFGGCRGNANNFRTKTECQNVCLREKSTSTTTTTISQPVTVRKVCIYSNWSDWSSCDNNCQNQQTRIRFLIEKNDDCTESISETRKCQSEKCNSPNNGFISLRNCKYSSWSEWSACSSRCGPGVRERKRKKLSRNCKPEFPQFTDRESCYNACAYD